jgi:hypothetical protein
MCTTALLTQPLADNSHQHTAEKDYWIKCKDHVMKEEDNYWLIDGFRFLQPTTVISLSDSSDST